MSEASQASSRRVGVCSWSLLSGDASELAGTVRGQLGCGVVQLALDPMIDRAWDEATTLEALSASEVEISSVMFAPVGEDYTTPDSIRRTGGFAPDVTWDKNRARAERAAGIASTLDASLVTMHAGAFVRADSALESAMVERIREIVSIFMDRGVRVGFETGHESAEDTLRLLAALDVEGAGVNFDPANMLLYGSGDPIDAFEALLPRVVQCHVKDAIPPKVPGEWGAEVPVGDGAVDWAAFMRVLEQSERPIDLMVEREAGEDRVGDMNTALRVIDRFHREIRR